MTQVRVNKSSGPKTRVINIQITFTVYMSATDRNNQKHMLTNQVSSDDYHPDYKKR